MKNWYPDAPVIDIRQVSKMDLSWCKQFDALLLFETPFYWPVIQYCRIHGIKTFLVPMYECSPEILPYSPDVFLCPSLLDLQEFPATKETKSLLCSIPIDVPWKLRTHALSFVHNGGYLGMRGREGTELLIEAMSLVRAPLRLTIRVQENVSSRHQQLAAKDKRIEYINYSVPYEDLYTEGDVSILPQKFNGMSMPLMESRASGMLVMTTNRFPTTNWLYETGALIPNSGFDRVRLSPRFRTIDEAKISPIDIANVIDHWYGGEIEEQSRWGKKWAEANSWETLKPKWLELLKE